VEHTLLHTLFTDDTYLLRKLFIRLVSKVLGDRKPKKTLEIPSLFVRHLF